MCIFLTCMEEKCRQAKRIRLTRLSQSHCGQVGHFFNENLLKRKDNYWLFNQKFYVSLTQGIIDTPLLWCFTNQGWQRFDCLKWDAWNNSRADKNLIRRVYLHWGKSKTILVTIIEAIVPSIILAKDLFNIMFQQLILSHFSFMQWLRRILNIIPV